MNRLFSILVSLFLLFLVQPRCPWLIIQGDEDELVGIDETIDWVNSLDEGPELLVVQGGEHFFHGKLMVVREAVRDFVVGN